jgi:hypothetical protein
MVNSKAETFSAVSMNVSMGEDIAARGLISCLRIEITFLKWARGLRRSDGKLQIDLVRTDTMQEASLKSENFCRKPGPGFP